MPAARTVWCRYGGTVVTAITGTPMSEKRMSNFLQPAGCAGSLLITVVPSALLILVMRACSTDPGTRF